MARKEKKLKHDFYLYSMEINPHKPAGKYIRYSKDEVREITRDLKEVLELTESKVAVVFTLSNIHLSAYKDKAYIKEHGVPKVFTDWHIHASMVSFDYSEIEQAVTYIINFLEARFEPLEKFPTLLNISGYNCNRSKDEQEKLGYHWYNKETGNTGYFDLYQKSQQHGNNVIYNGTDRAISRTRAFDNFIHNNNMINCTNVKGYPRLANNIKKMESYFNDVAVMAGIGKVVCDIAIDRFETEFDRYKKTQSLEDLQEAIDDLRFTEALIQAKFMKTFMDMGFK